MALYIDLPSKRIEVFKEEILINQLRDENEEKAKAFDDQYHEQFAAMSAEYTRLAANLWAGVRSLEAENALDTGQAAAGSLLQYALKTIEALIDLLRRGYRNQVGMLARNALEIIATVNQVSWKKLHQVKSNTAQNSRCASLCTCELH